MVAIEAFKLPSYIAMCAAMIKEFSIIVPGPLPVEAIGADIPACRRRRVLSVRNHTPGTELERVERGLPRVIRLVQVVGTQ